MENAEVSSTKPQSVLVVDDDTQCRRLVVRLLGELGYGLTYEAYSATEALRLLSQIRPTMVLTDIVMERQRSGLAVVSQARSAGIPVGLITGVGSCQNDPELLALPRLMKDELGIESMRTFVGSLLGGHEPAD